MAKSKSIADKFAALPKSRRVQLSQEQEAIVTEYIGLYLEAVSPPTMANLAALITSEVGCPYSENVLRRRIEDARRDKEKV